VRCLLKSTERSVDRIAIVRYQVETWPRNFDTASM
jgi:hypothetical protein